MRWFRQVRLISPGKRRSRLSVLAGLGVMLAGGIVAVTPGVASAGAIVPCPSGITEWKLIAGVGVSPESDISPDGIVPWRNVWEGYRYTLVSAVPQFLVSEGRALDNQSNAPVNYEISSSISKTYKISATVGISTGGTTDFLKANVSFAIEASVTTQVGVKLSTTVPPMTRLIAEYGTDVYQVSYYIEAWRWKGPWLVKAPPPAPGTPGCEEWGYYPQNTQAPTRLETWRLRNG